MFHRWKTLIIVIVLLVGGFVFFVREATEPDRVPINNGSGIMKVESDVFRHGASIPSRYTCDGDNISPPLKISGVPEGTASLVLVIDDPDAPAGTWIHWTVWNIPPETAGIAEGTAPDSAVEGMTSFGITGYGGPCPPSGVHRYFFKLYALDTALELPEGAVIADLEREMAGHVIDKAGLIGLYGRE